MDRSIRKAVIPAAGFGTRLFPATQVVKKELFPVVDRHGWVKPAILAIVEEALSAGIEEVGIVLQPGDLPTFEALFKHPPKPELFHKLKPHHREYSQFLQTLGKRVTFLTQETQDGYGHAIFCAKSWVGDAPFMLLLGDHVYTSDLDASCALQVKTVYEQMGHSVIGLRVAVGEAIQHSGCAAGDWQDADGRVLSLSSIYEKPTLDYARQHFHVEGMATDEFLSMFGIYVLEAEIFENLERHIQQNFREGGEFQLTSCLEELRRQKGMTGYLVQGRCFDIGMPQLYRQTVHEFG